MPIEIFSKGLPFGHGINVPFSIYVPALGVHREIPNESMSVGLNVVVFRPESTADVPNQEIVTFTDESSITTERYDFRLAEFHLLSVGITLLHQDPCTVSQGENPRFSPW